MAREKLREKRLKAKRKLNKNKQGAEEAGNDMSDSEQVGGAIGD